MATPTILSSCGTAGGLVVSQVFSTISRCKWASGLLGDGGRAEEVGTYHCRKSVWVKSIWGEGA